MLYPLYWISRAVYDEKEHGPFRLLKIVFTKKKPTKLIMNLCSLYSCIQVWTAAQAELISPSPH